MTLGPCPGCGLVTCMAWGDECWFANGCPSTFPPTPKLIPAEPPATPSREFERVTLERAQILLRPRSA